VAVPDNAASARHHHAARRSPRRDGKTRPRIDSKKPARQNALPRHARRTLMPFTALKPPVASRVMKIDSDMAERCEGGIQVYAESAVMQSRTGAQVRVYAVLCRLGNHSDSAACSIKGMQPHGQRYVASACGRQRMAPRSMLTAQLRAMKGVQKQVAAFSKRYLLRP